MRQNSGQAAIIFILIIAIIFLFTAITVNISKVAELKHTVSVVARGAAIDLAVKLGSYSKLLDEKGDSVAGWDLKYLVKQGMGIGFIIAGILTENPLLIKSGATMIGTTTINRVLVGLDTAMANRKLTEAGMDLKGQWREQAIQYALTRVVDDPKMVKDIIDIDEDGDTDEQVSRFAVNYYARTNNIVAELEKSNELLLSYLEAFQSPLERFRDEMVGFSAFLQDEFIPLLRELKNQEFPVSFWKEGVDWDNMQDEDPASVNDDIDRLRYIINYSENEDTFEAFVASTIEGLEDGMLITADVFKPWNKRLYDTENESNDDWYFTFGRYSTAMESWLVELRNIRDNHLTEQSAKDSVNDVITSITSANNLTDGSIQEFREAVDGFEAAIESAFTDTGEAIAVKYNPVTYSWHDSRGNHFVRVYVHGFYVPELDITTHWYGETDYVVDNKTGSCGVDVTRFDEGQDTYLWNFRYTKDAEAGISGPLEEAGFDLPGAEETALEHGISTKATRDYYCGGASSE